MHCWQLRSFQLHIGIALVKYPQWGLSRSTMHGVVVREFHQCYELHPNILFLVGPSVSNGSGEPASGSGSDQKNSSVRFQNRPKSPSAASWQAKPGPGPVNPWVLPGLATPFGSNLRFCVSGFLFMVAFRYLNVNRKILNFAHH